MIHGKVNILLVDDDARNLDALESVLESPDYRLVRASSGAEALRALLDDDFAVMVLDVRMPDMNGIELAQMVKQRRKTHDLPILFLTAYYGEDQQVLEGYGAGGVDYLSKPVHPEVLRSKVAVFVELFRKARALVFEVNERREAERQIQKLNDQLTARVAELAAANQELEEFSYSVSHDLRAPLRHVAGFVRLLEERSAEKLDEESREYLHAVREAAARMGQLVDGLLEFSRFGRTEMRQGPVDLALLLDQTLRGIPLETQGREIEWRVAPLPVVQGDEPMLRQVWWNLLDNAVKFTSKKPRAVIEIGWQANGGAEMLFWVRDNGAGFDMSHAGKLFGVFQRMHPRTEFEGTGIGLASVRRIVQRHGGRIWADSIPGEGTTLYFTLPKEGQDAT
ncbi:MAG: ATP-binding protein [Candidatus Eisenbacteria bacterium]|nr:response regulator [Candidatus Eisenbacteria bacterium]